MSSMLEELRRLEAELHHPGAGCSRERLEQLLHPDFHEIGRSGAPYTRRMVIDYLLTQIPPPVVESDAHAVHRLAEHCALLTYRSAQRLPDGAYTHAAQRSSVWLRMAQQWQLFYHQGTPAP